MEERIAECLCNIVVEAQKEESLYIEWEALDDEGVDSWKETAKELMALIFDDNQELPENPYSNPQDNKPIVYIIPTRERVIMGIQGRNMDVLEYGCAVGMDVLVKAGWWKIRE